MTHKTTYCSHCGIKYYYQGSGHGCGDPLNNSKHCTECMSVIVTALSRVPKKVEMRWIDSSEYTFDQIIELTEKYDAEQDRIHNERQKGSIIQIIRPRRVFPGLVDLKTGECSENRYGIINGVEYSVTWMKSKPEDYSVRKRAHWDLINNKLIENY